MKSPTEFAEQAYIEFSASSRCDPACQLKLTPRALVMPPGERADLQAGGDRRGRRAAFCGFSCAAPAVARRANARPGLINIALFQIKP